MQNENYKNKFGISQSMIKDFKFKSPKRWKEIHLDRQEDIDKNENTFIFGSLTDTLLFTPSELTDRFYIGGFHPPSKAIESITTQILSDIVLENSRYKSESKELTLLDIKEIPLSLNSPEAIDIILRAANNYEEGEKKGWNITWKPETRIEKIRKLGGEYFEHLVNANGRKVITQMMNMEALELKNVLHNHKDVKHYFVSSSENELLFQLEIFIDFILHNGKSIPLKGAIDILRIDHEKKTIQLADFKTTYDAHDFIKSIKKYGYATQLSFYDSILRIWLTDYCEGKFCNYTILNPINIVIDKYNKIPYIYEYKWEDIVLEREGNESFLFDLYQTKDHKMPIKKGWQNTLEEIAWHYFENKWDKPKELYENKKIIVNLS